MAVKRAVQKAGCSVCLLVALKDDQSAGETVLKRADQMGAATACW